ncbi:PepSY domain-containing protein [Nocardia sp. NPDC050710]|uniref:PepSY-associated TM helix domain-containing protein n=1 Tax=Nocardia sp. NPDC050710 TaxID=3157220 RepID=UPI0034100140
MSSTTTDFGDPAESPADRDGLDESADTATTSTDNTATDSADGSTAKSSVTERALPRSWRPLVLRLHFYAGVLVAPFILIAALTGGLYALAPTIEKFVYSDELTVESTGAAALPLSQQVAAARAAYPDLTVSAVLPPSSSTTSTRVHFIDPGLGEEQLRAVFVDPYTGAVSGSETSWFGSLPFSTWVDVLHRDLHLGEFGNLYSELAASWLWVVVLGGLLLWWAKYRGDRVRGRRARIIGVDRSVRGRARTLNWHGASGLWIAAALLFLSATGITWSPYAGEHVTDLRAAMSWQRPQLDTALGHDETSTDGSHSEHGAAQPGSVDISGIDLDRVVEIADRAGVAAPVEITLPTEPGQAIGVAEAAKPYRLTTDSVAIDPGTSQVTGNVDYNRDYPLFAKLADWGIRGHMGILFGLLNQLLLLAIALVLVTVIVRGYRMWWQRRPTRGSAFALGRPPIRGGIARAPVAGIVVLAIVAVAVGWFLPLLGISLLVFLTLDIAIGAVGRRAARSAPTAQVR